MKSSLGIISFFLIFTFSSFAQIVHPIGGKQETEERKTNFKAGLIGGINYSKLNRESSFIPPEYKLGMDAGS